MRFMKVDVARIKLERIKKGWSQTQLARVIGSHPSLISQIEGGTVGGSPSTIKAISDALGISMDELLETEKVS